MTNLRRPPGFLHEKVYCARGDVENRIKELLDGMQIDRTFAPCAVVLSDTDVVQPDLPIWWSRSFLPAAAGSRRTGCAFLCSGVVMPRGGVSDLPIVRGDGPCNAWFAAAIDAD